MSALLAIEAFGSPSFRYKDVPLRDFTSTKAQALFLYLACTRRPHAREVLAELLWDERDPSQGRANLRVLLTRLPQPIQPYVHATREMITFELERPYQLDVEAFETYGLAALLADETRASLTTAETQRFDEALRLYRGPFLDGFYLDGSRGFEEWMLDQRARLERQAITMLRSLVTHCLAQGNYQSGVGYASRLLQIDPLDEDAFCHMMRLLAAQGHRASALEHYEILTKRLDDELGVEPAPETRALAASIRAGQVTAPVGVPRLREQAARLPLPLTSFVGRESELALLAQRLADRACRLVTVIGPGGSGKTRLAMQAASKSSTFADGVYFVNLAPVSKPTHVAAAIADALGCPADDQRSAVAAVLAALRDRQALLLLDNFEHVQAAAPWLSDLLRTAPEIKVLVTSRVPLRIEAEWLVDIGGLDLPPESPDGPIDRYDAVRLFVETVRRVDPDFILTEATRKSVARICRLVDGLPLGIELAAAWVRSQDCLTIAEEIARDLDFLSSPLQDVPDRHRSLRAAFDHSWTLLTEAERAAFQRLAVFSGGFDPAAANQVAGLNRRMLAELIDRSLVRRAPNGRYDLHPLLRQYAAERLRQDFDEWDAALARHHAYYQALVEMVDLEPGQHDPRGWVDRLEQEFENLMLALGDLNTSDPAPSSAAPESVPTSSPPKYDLPTHFEATIIVRRAPEDVFAFLMNLENYPLWFTNILRARYTTLGSPGVGTTIWFEVQFLGRRNETTAIITEYEPNQRITYHSTSGPAFYRNQFVLAAAADGTRLTVVNDSDAGGLFRIVRFIFVHLARRSFDTHVRSLKEILDSSAPS